MGAGLLNFGSEEKGLLDRGGVPKLNFKGSTILCNILNNRATEKFSK